MLQEKTKEVKEINFNSSRVRTYDDKKIFKQDKNSFNLVLPYTSHYCDTVAQNSLKIIKTVKPKFKLKRKES